MLTSAFWRQTSKRGLDFCKSRGETVIFDWSKYSGEETDGAELNDKWWKNGSADLRNQHGAAITNSEMRHLRTAKYAQAAGTGRVVRVQGSLSQASAEAAVAQKLDNLKSLPKEDLDMLRKDLKEAFDKRTLDDYMPFARNLVRDVPDLLMLGWFSGNLVDSGAVKAVEAALNRLASRLEATKSPLVQTAMLANMPTLFQNELMKDPAIVEILARSASRNETHDARTTDVQTLAGLDHGRGLEAFFASDTGRANALGELLVDVAAREHLPVNSLVDELTTAFAEKFGCSADEAIRHSAFKTFLVRAASTNRDMESLIASLDTVKTAYDAKVAVGANLAQSEALAPEAQAVFARRGDWDLNRLVFKEAVAAKAEGRPVDIQKLQRNAEVIRDICTSAVAFVNEIEAKVGTPFTESERNRLVDSYLDRDRSTVNAYRLHGDENDVKELAKEHADVLKRTGQLVQSIQTLAAGRLSPSVIKSLVIDGVATRAKEVHVAVAIAALDAARTGTPVDLSNGRTATERVENFIRELSERFRPAFETDYPQYREDVEAGIGYDDHNTMMRLCFNAHQIEHPEITAFLDGAVNEEVIDHLWTFGETVRDDGVIPHLLDMVRAHGEV